MPAKPPLAQPTDERGRFNSSITRVRPFFTQLMQRDPSGRDWLPALLNAAPRANALLPQTVTQDPGELLPQLTEVREYHDLVLGVIQLMRCFEHPAPPSAAFLRWLLEHPEKLTWPTHAGRRRKFAPTTQAFREALIDGRGPKRAEAQHSALAELKRLGAGGSKRRAWAFEGFTEVDCWLETPRLLLFVEGKRTEPLSSSTDWYPQRNQLVRNLDVLAEVAGNRVGGVLLVTQTPAPELTAADIATSAPHLNPGQQTQLYGRYLGQTTWSALATAVHLDPEALPATLSDALIG